MRSTVSWREAPGLRVAQRSLNAPSIPDADASAFRPIQRTPYRIGSGKTAPGPTSYTYSGDRPIPTTRSAFRFPWITAPIPSPGRSRCACANASLAMTSSSRPGVTLRPSRRCSAFNAGSPASGTETRSPRIGSVNPGTSTFAHAKTRVSTRSTPGIARTVSAELSGARFKETNSSANR